MILTQDFARRDKARLHRTRQEAHPRNNRVHVLDGRTRCHETDADHRGLGPGGADRHPSVPPGQELRDHRHLLAPPGGAKDAVHLGTGPVASMH